MVLQKQIVDSNYTTQDNEPCEITPSLICNINFIYYCFQKLTNYFYK